MIRSPLAAIGIAASFLVASAPREASTEPARTPPKAKPSATTQSDIERLEKKVAEHQRVLEKMVKLQQQYLTSMMSLLADTGASGDSEPRTDGRSRADAEPRADAKTEGKTDARGEA